MKEQCCKISSWAFNSMIYNWSPSVAVDWCSGLSVLLS